MAKRTRNRMDLRAEHEAYEARQRQEEEDEGGEDEEEEETDEEETDEEEAEADEEGAGAGTGDEEEEEEEAKPKKKKKPAKEPKPKRVRTPKHVRMRVVWGVFNNSNQRVHTFQYPQRREAEEYAAKMKAESKTNQTYFVQPVKEAIEEKKE